MSSVVVIGGTSGLGKEVARFYAGRGDEVVLTGRDAERAAAVAEEVGAARGLALDLSRPHGVKEALADVGRVDGLVLTAIARDHNSIHSYDIEAALHLLTLKFVGYIRTATMADVVDAVDFLLRNRSVNGIDLTIDGGWLLR
ncbi:SDR family NAD(P)-dependent oxidoreductase [Streptomyces sp. NPDC052727]|uniref:SDR family NAD(P)-dependent oxidoreductase n=1 Tax=Streptomyces sp. NPDC052727 TaxID=3154854 RepID=UPI0034345AD1